MHAQRLPLGVDWPGCGLEFDGIFRAIALTDRTVATNTLKRRGTTCRGLGMRVTGHVSRCVARRRTRGSIGAGQTQGTAEAGLVQQHGSQPRRHRRQLGGPDLGFQRQLRHVWKDARFELEGNVVRSNTSDDRYFMVGPGLEFPVGGAPANPPTSLIKPDPTPDVANYLISGSYERNITPAFFWNAGGSWDRNDDAGILNRYIAHAGVGNKWVDTARRRFTTSYGCQLQRSRRGGARSGQGPPLYRRPSRLGVHGAVQRGNHVRQQVRNEHQSFRCRRLLDQHYQRADGGGRQPRLAQGQPSVAVRERAGARVRPRRHRLRRADQPGRRPGHGRRDLPDAVIRRIEARARLRGRAEGQSWIPSSGRRSSSSSEAVS